MSANVFDVVPEADESDPPGYGAGTTRVGPLVGGEAMGMSVYELPPGQSICPYHYELAEEEWLVVLSGSATVRTPEGEQVLGPWDAVCFAPGEGGAHKVTNATGEPLRVAMLSTKPPISVCVYPDSEQGRRLAARQAVPAGRRGRLLGGRAVSGPGRQDPVARDEVEALVAARSELPEGHDQELIDAFMERVSAEIDARVDQRLAEQEDDDDYPVPGQIGVAIGSIALGIPVTAVAGSTAELPGVVVAWIGIVLVNVLFARSRR